MVVFGEAASNRSQLACGSLSIHFDSQVTARVTLIGDIFSLVFANLEPPQKALSLIQLLKSERHYTVWALSIQQLNKLADLIVSEPYFGTFQVLSCALNLEAIFEISSARDCPVRWLGEQ